jgi:hypothetical protein
MVMMHEGPLPNGNPEFEQTSPETETDPEHSFEGLKQGCRGVERFRALDTGQMLFAFDDFAVPARFVTL